MIAIISHERKPCNELPPSPSSSISSLSDESAEEEDDLDSTTELQARFFETGHIITCLYKFSIAIRSPAQRDRLQKCASIDVSHYEFFDIQHTSNKFPGVEQHLIDRLGKANTRRRQLLIYHKRHHDKLTRYIDLPVDSQGDRQAKLDPAKKGENVTTEDPTLQNQDANPNPDIIAPTVNTQTTVSTFVQSTARGIGAGSDTGRSQTSYATSAATEDPRHKLRVPPPPKAGSALDGTPFECPYCFSIVSMDGTQSWM